MRSYLYFFAALLLACAVPAALFYQKTEKPHLILLSGAGMKEPISEITASFEKKTGIPVDTYFEGSAVLSNYIRDFNTGDVFLSGDLKNLEKLNQSGLVAGQSFLAWHGVALLVSKEMKGRIKGLDDMAGEGIRIAISNPRQASLGKIVTSRILGKHPKGEAILNNVVAYGSSSQDVLNLFQQGGIDAVIEWDVMAATPEGAGLEVIPIEEPYAVRDKLVVGLLKTSENSEKAKQLYTYIFTEGRDVFRRYGYNVDSNAYE